MLINDPQTLTEVETAFLAYETALMANDLDALDALFWNSPLTVRIGPPRRLSTAQSSQIGDHHIRHGLRYRQRRIPARRRT